MDIDLNQAQLDALDLVQEYFSGYTARYLTREAGDEPNPANRSLSVWRSNCTRRVLNYLTDDQLGVELDVRVKALRHQLQHLATESEKMGMWSSGIAKWGPMYRDDMRMNTPIERAEFFKSLQVDDWMDLVVEHTRETVCALLPVPVVAPTPTQEFMVANGAGEETPTEIALTVPPLAQTKADRDSSPVRADTAYGKPA